MNTRAFDEDSDAHEGNAYLWILAIFTTQISYRNGAGDYLDKISWKVWMPKVFVCHLSQ